MFTDFRLCGVDNIQDDKGYLWKGIKMINVATERVKTIAVLMAEGMTVEEIAAEFQEPMLSIENTMNFIREISAISKPKPAASDKLDFIDLMSILREFVSGTFAGACITAEYGNNRQGETEIDFTFGNTNYTLSLYESDRSIICKKVQEC